MANYTKPHMFNIVLNSALASPPGYVANNADRSYNFNWSNIPKGKYVMTWSYRGLMQTNLTENDSPQVFLSMGSTPSTYIAGGTLTNNIITNYIGNLQTTTHANTDVYFCADSYQNCPVFYESIPTDNVIRVQMFDFDWVTPYTALIGLEPLAAYVLTLHFEQRQ